MTVKLPVTKRIRRYGYIYWLEKDDPVVRDLLGSKRAVEILFDGRPLGKKRIDWKYRRVSVGKKVTRQFANGSVHLDLDANGRLGMRCP